MTALMMGSEAIAATAVAVGCRFFAGYPMSPFTELLEQFSAQLPPAGGVCIRAESEIEAVNMTLGAAATGARAATGSCGQGLALMQEAIAESALNETPLVLFNMARNQQDYFQATRGGGWGDYRTLTLAPKDVFEAVEHTQLLFHLADLYRAPTLLYGDHFIAQTYVGIDIELLDLPELPAKDWALDGTRGGTGKSRQIWTWDMGKPLSPGRGPDGHWRDVAAKFATMAENEVRWEADHADDAEVVVVSFGTASVFVEYAVERLRAEGLSIGYFRPVTLWPFPYDALAAVAAEARSILVFELNAGQMIDDVMLSVPDRGRVHSIGGVSAHSSGLRHGPLMDAPVVEARIRNALRVGV